MGRIRPRVSLKAHRRLRSQHGNCALWRRCPWCSGAWCSGATHLAPHGRQLVAAATSSPNGGIHTRTRSQRRPRQRRLGRDGYSASPLHGCVVGTLLCTVAALTPHALRVERGAEPLKGCEHLPRCGDGE
jgi:hypothetical protein